MLRLDCLLAGVINNLLYRSEIQILDLELPKSKITIKQSMAMAGRHLPLDCTII